jgi:hypothetical protein
MIAPRCDHTRVATRCRLDLGQDEPLVALQDEVDLEVIAVTVEEETESPCLVRPSLVHQRRELRRLVRAAKRD